jgi:hypothetical protein
MKARLTTPASEFTLVGAVWLWVAWPFLAPGKFVYGFDTLSYSGPAIKTTFDSWKSLRIPLWSEFIFGGVPFLGRLGAQALYFPNLPFAFFKLNTAMDLIMAAHLLLLGLGVLVLIRYGFKLPSPAGSVAAITVLTSAFVAVKTLSFDQLIALAWLPWILFFLEKMITTERPYKYFSGLGFSVAALVFGGHPQFIYLFLCLSSLFAISRIIDLRAWKSLPPLLACAASTVGICLLQIYSTYALNASSVMGTKKSLESLTNSAYVLPSNRIFEGVVGNPFSSNPASVSGAGEAIAGVSVFVLLLAVLGCFRLWTSQQRLTMIFLLVLGTIAVPLSMGPQWTFFELFYDWVPGFGNARVAGRLLSLTLVCAVLLAAFGIQYVVETIQNGGNRRSIQVVVGFLSTVFFLLNLKSQNSIQLALILMSAGLLVFVMLMRNRMARNLLGGASLIFLVLVPAYASQRHSPGRLSQQPVAFDSYTNEIDEFLSSQDGFTIAMTFDRMDNASYLVTTLRPNTNILHDIRLIDGYDGGMWVQKRWVEAMKSVTGGKFNNDLTVRSQVVFPISAPVMSRQGVRWALIDTEVIGADVQLSGWVGPQMVDGTLQLWQNPTWSGIATSYVQTQLQGSSTEFLSNISNLDQLQILAVEKNGPVLSCSRLCNSVAPLSSYYSGDVGRFETNVPQKSVAAIHVSWSKDWRVYVNGIEAEIFPVDINQVGVLLPPGLNKVTFQYLPKWFPPLFGLMVVSIILSLLVTASSFLGTKSNATRDH